MVNRFQVGLVVLMVSIIGYSETVVSVTGIRPHSTVEEPGTINAQVNLGGVVTTITTNSLAIPTAPSPALEPLVNSTTYGLAVSNLTFDGFVDVTVTFDLTLTASSLGGDSDGLNHRLQVSGVFENHWGVNSTDNNYKRYLSGEESITFSVDNVTLNEPDLMVASVRFRNEDPFVKYGVLSEVYAVWDPTNGIVSASAYQGTNGDGIGVKNLGIDFVIEEVGDAESLLAGYFDIETNQTAGAVVNGKVNLLRNKDAHEASFPTNYSFSILSDPSGLFSISDEMDSEGRLFGVFKVAAGQTTPVSSADFPMSVVLMDGVTVVAETNVVIKVVDKCLIDTFSEYAEEHCLESNKLFGRRYYDDAETEILLSELEVNGGQFTSEWYYAAGGVWTNFPFYSHDILSYTNAPGAGTKTPLIKEEWREAMARIGGLGRQYKVSAVYGPDGDPAQHERLKLALYLALESLLPRIPVAPSDVMYLGQPVGEDYGDGISHLSNGNSGLYILHYNVVTHIWDPFEYLSGPIVWLMPSLKEEMVSGDSRAIALHEQIVRFFQLQFVEAADQTLIEGNGARWKNLIDTNHTEGAFMDANLGHRLRSWICMPAIWADYNRPITYVPYWYDGYYDDVAGSGFQFKPGWSPRGVVFDLSHWFRTWHSPTHFFVQPGFHPDGSVSHHVGGDTTDASMFSYGYGWLSAITKGYELYKDTIWDLGSDGFQFIADRYLHSYDKLIYKGDFDYTMAGRGYWVDLDDKFVADIPSDIDRLLGAKGYSTIISNESVLVDWRNSIADGTHQVSGNFPFWIGQSLVHRRGASPGEDPYYFSVKMENDRTNGAEEFESTKKSWHLGSGILQSRVRGDEYGEDVRSKWDWHALPGLTEEWRNDPIVGDGPKHGGSPYAGMTSDGLYGFSAMEYRSQGNYSVAEADKGFFFTETESIALGVNIARRSVGQGLDIVTSVDQARWVGDVTYSLDGAAPSVLSLGNNPDLKLYPTTTSWLHQGDVGYVIFPQGGQALYIKGGSAIQATDAGLAAGSSAELIYFGLDHGVDPEGVGLTNYQYVMVPNMTAAAMPAYVADLTNRVEIVANANGVQGIYDASLELVQLAFYQATSATVSGLGLEVTVDRPALVQLRRNDSVWEFAVADPIHDYDDSSLTVTLNEFIRSGSYAYKHGGVQPRSGESVIVSTNVSGISIEVELPDPTDDDELNYQAELYAGVPIHIELPYDYYAEWADHYSLTEGVLYDSDHDGWDNLTEFAMGGIPTNAADAVSLSPIFKPLMQQPDTMNYIYRRKTDYEQVGLSYVIEYTDSLVDPSWETNGIAFGGAEILGPGLEAVTNTLNIGTNNNGFMRLKILQ